MHKINKPVVEGYYWARCKNGTKYMIIECTKSQFKDGMNCWFTGMDYPYSTDIFDHFIGPLEVPKELE